MTFHLIVFGWILFRSETIYLAGVFISRLFTVGAPTLWTAPVVGAIVLVIGMQLLPEKPLERFQVRIERMRPALLAAGSRHSDRVRQRHRAHAGRSPLHLLPLLR